MSKFSVLPIEIWLLIVSYLPKSQLSQLKSLNSFFLNHWMDIRWKYVGIEAFSSSTVAKLLRLVDPFVASRVNTLYLCVTSDYTESLSTPLLLSVLPLLSKTTCLKIDISSEYTSSFAALFRAISSSPLARTLQKLQIFGYSAMFASQVASAAHTFENLTDLDFWLEDIGHSDISQGIIQFPLRILAPTLQSLYINSTSDLFVLFCNTLDSSVPFPNLKSLDLAISINGPFPKSLFQSVHRFIHDHSNNLQFLQVSTSFLPVIGEPLGVWLAELVNSNIQFPSLQTLQVCPSYSQIGLSAILTLIQRTAPTLSSLTILHRCLTREEVSQLLDALTEAQVQTTMGPRQSNLIVLDMRISQLSVPLLDLLARKLPQLESLTLFVSEIVGSDQDSFCDLLHRRRYDQPTDSGNPSQDILHTWKLRYLSIRKWDSQIFDAMCAVAGTVSSLLLRMD